MVLVIVFAFVIVLAGCGSKQTQDTTQAATAQEEKKDEPKKEETKKEEVKKEEKPVEISIGHWLWKTEFLPHLTKAFNAKFPNIKFNYEYMKYEDYVNKLKVNLASGSGWDIFVTQAGALADSSKSYCEPLAPLCEKEWGADWKNKFYPDAMKPVNSIGNDIIGLPDSMSFAGMLFINMTKLKKYNLQPPKTYDELKAFAKTLRDNKDLPVVIGAKDTWVDIDLFTVIANDIAAGKIYKADKGEIQWTDPDIIKALEAWQGLFKDKVIQDGALGVPQYMTVAEMYWKKLQGGAIFDGDWTLGIFTVDEWKKDSNRDEYQVIPFPDMNGDGKPCPVSASPGSIWSINKASSAEKKDAAWKLLKWYIAEEGLKVMTSKEVGMTYNPAFKDVKITYENDSANFKTCAQNIMNLANNVGGDRELSNADVKKTLGEVLQEIAAGLKPADGAVKLQKVANKSKK